MSALCISPNGDASAASEESPEVLLVGTIRGVVRLGRHGSQWKVESTSLESFQIAALLNDVSSGTVIAATYDPGCLFVSRDEGHTWSEDCLQVDGVRLFSLTRQDLPDGMVIYAGGEPVSIYRSADVGETWTELPGVRMNETAFWTFPTPPKLAHVKHVASSSTDPLKLFASIEQGALLRSDDGGTSWIEIESFLTPSDQFHSDIHRLVFSPVNADHLYMTTGEGFYRSLDGGTTWEHTLGAGARIAYPDPLFVDPDHPETLYIAGAGLFPGGWRDGPDGTAEAAILRSDDSGVTWREVMHGLPSPIHGNIEAMSMASTSDGLFFVIATTQGEIFASYDAAESWEMIASNLAPISKGYHYRKFLPIDERKRVEASW